MPENEIRLIVGLGNPGRKYRNNRHNLGFHVVEELARRKGLTFQPADDRYLVAGGPGAADHLVLLMPLTYMNLSGEAVERWSQKAAIPVTGMADTPVAGSPDEACEQETRPGGIRPLVVCDDLNLPLGSVRLRARGSSGGQNGLASVAEHLGGEDFPRLRLGVAPLGGEVAPADWPEYVLSDFAEEERSAAGEMVGHAADALEFWLKNGLEATISRFNRRVKPPTDAPED